MFNWYKWAEICYAYLDDIATADEKEYFHLCRWFKRGWTLQELLAPERISFYSYNWQYSGSKSTLAQKISDTTGIPMLALRRREYIPVYSIATKMCWAASRKTTRIEDMAYSLMGIFGVNMPLLYGEGEQAFIRLQEELIRLSDDESLFAWNGIRTPQHGILADSPLGFVGCRDVVVARLCRTNWNVNGDNSIPIKLANNKKRKREPTSTDSSPTLKQMKSNYIELENASFNDVVWQKEPYSLSKLGLRIELPMIHKKDIC